ncbi:hypothetical protein GYB62_02710 [bacterium]|nr:hypothetical protein [bacterium]
MKAFLNFIALVCASTLLLAVSLCAGLLFSLTSHSPSVAELQKTSVADIQRIKQLLISRNHRRYQGQYELQVSQRDINVGISHFLPTLSNIKNVFAQVTLNDDAATVNASVKIEQLPWQPYVNMSLHIEERNEQLAVGPLSIGKLTLSEAMSQALFKQLVTLAEQDSRASQGLRTWDSVSGIDLQKESARIRYQRDTQQTMTLDDYESLLISGDEKTLIREYTTMIEALPQSGPLIDLLKPLFAFAKSRSLSNGQPVTENRVLLIALGKHFGGEQLIKLIEQGQLPSARHMNTRHTVHRRRDLAQHLVISAGLTVVADGELADAIGMDKEISDLGIGSVISAWDLLADRAGVRLAQRATQSAKSALEVQEALANIQQDENLLPDLGRSFSGRYDQFSPDDLHELSMMVDLSLDQLKLYKR